MLSGKQANFPLSSLQLLRSKAVIVAVALLFNSIDRGNCQTRQTHKVGINYGRLASSLPAPDAVANLIKSLNFGYVKIYDSNAAVIKAFANTGLPLSICIPNEEVAGVGRDPDAADRWLQQNMLPYYPATQINMIMVGNEILSDNNLVTETWPWLVSAMENIYSSLQRSGLNQSIKVTTSVAMDALSTSYPPSEGMFKEELQPILKEMLSFLSKTGSYFFLDVYPYLAWKSNTQEISLDYAMFGPNAGVVKDGKNQYTNMLDAQIDAVIAAGEKLGYGDVGIAVSETGWPTAGDEDEPGASKQNAGLYNGRLVKKVVGAGGTPRRPKAFFPTYVFALFNENQKPGPSSERNWGLLYPDGSLVYSLDLRGT